MANIVAYEKGEKAFNDGQPRTYNIYRLGTEAYKSWDQGWCNASNKKAKEWNTKK